MRILSNRIPHCRSSRWCGVSCVSRYFKFIIQCFLTFFFGPSLDIKNGTFYGMKTMNPLLHSRNSSKILEVAFKLRLFHHSVKFLRHNSRCCVVRFPNPLATGHSWQLGNLVRCCEVPRTCITTIGFILKYIWPPLTSPPHIIPHICHG